MILTINGRLAALEKGSSIEYVLENCIFTDTDDDTSKGKEQNKSFKLGNDLEADNGLFPHYQR